MPYGTIKVDTITFTSGSSDVSVAISGLVQNPTFSGDVTVTGTVSGTVVRGNTVSGATVTGTAGQFGTLTGNTAGFTTVTGTTVTGTTGSFTSGVFASGTAAAPSVSVGTTTNGIYSPASNEVAISTNSTGRLFVDSSGRVGVGTSSPSRQFSLSDTNPTATFRSTSTTGQCTLFFGDSDSDARGAITYENNGDKLGLWSAGGQKLTIDSSGNVGIGTSTVDQLLHLKASAPKFKIEGTGTSDEVGIHFAANANNWFIRSDNSTGQNTFSIKSGTPASSTHRLLIDSSGNVGIGTTTVSETLHLKASAPRIRIEDAEGGYSNIEGDGGSLGIYADNGNTQANSFIRFDIDGTEKSRLTSSGQWLVGTSSSYGVGSSAQAKFQASDTTSNIHASFTDWSTANSGGIIVLGKAKGGSAGNYTIVANNDILGEIRFAGADGTDLETNGALIRAEVDGTPGANDMPGRLVFSTTADGASSPTERMRIDNGGNLLLNATSVIDVSMFSANIKTATNFATVKAPDTASYMAWQFQNSSGTRVGYIQFSTTATTFSTTSDYRLKENVTAVTDGIARLQQLKPSRFNFIADPGRTVDGFIAHEVQTVVPEAIQGEKDGVNADGNPIYQGIDQSKLVPLLTAALQEAIGEIESLKARVAALESA